MSWSSPGTARHAVPFGVSVPVGAAAVAAACLFAGALPAADAARLWLPALVAGGVGFAARDVRAGAALGAIAFLFVDGFSENRFGVLTWHAGDAGRLGLLLAVGVLGGLLGSAAAALEERRRHDVGVAALEAYANTGTAARTTVVRPDRRRSSAVRDEAAG